MNRVAIVGHKLDLLQHLGFSHNNTTAVAVLQNTKKKIALMSVVKLVHISSSKVFRSKEIINMFTEYVY